VRRKEMKFICEQSELQKALVTVSKAVTQKTTIPILKGILLNLEGNFLTLSASDLDISIEKKIEIKGLEDGTCVVPSRLFIDIIRKLPDEVVEFSLIELNQLLIKTSKTEFNITTFSGDEFPKITQHENENNFFTMDKNVFKDMVRKTSFAASLEDTKGLIVGILIEREKDSFNMIALDGFRMAVVREKISNEKEENIIIPAKLMDEMSRIITDEDPKEDVKFYIDTKKSLVSFDKTKVVLRLLEGEFIKYKDILPKDIKIKIKVSKRNLQEAIERAALFSREGRNNLIKFTISDTLLVITSKSEEGHLREETEIEKIGEDLEIGFNHKYILDVLKAVDDEDLIMEFNTPTSPMIIKREKDDYYEYLVLPVRING